MFEAPIPKSAQDCATLDLLIRTLVREGGVAIPFGPGAPVYRRSLHVRIFDHHQR